MRGARATGVILLTVAAATLLVAGCGSLTAGGVAEASVSVSGDAPQRQGMGSSPIGVALATALPSSLLRWVGLAGPTGSTFDRGGGDQPEGEVEVAFEIFLVTASGGQVPLSDREIRVRVEFPGTTEARPVNRRMIPAATYSRVRVVFTEIEAEVDRGLVVGGVPVAGPVDVELDGPSLTVEESLALEVPPGGQVELLLDLNSVAWLQAADPAARTVAANVFRNALRILPR